MLSKIIYGDNDAFIKTLSQEQRDLCLKILQGIKKFEVDQYFEAINNLKEEMRLVSKLHRLPSHHLNSGGLFQNGDPT